MMSSASAMELQGPRTRGSSPPLALRAPRQSSPAPSAASYTLPANRSWTSAPGDGSLTPMALVPLTPQLMASPAQTSVRSPVSSPQMAPFGNGFTPTQVTYGTATPPVVARPSNCASVPAYVVQVNRSRRDGRSSTPPRRSLSRSNKSLPILRAQEDPCNLGGLLYSALNNQQICGTTQPALRGLHIRILGWNSTGTTADLYAQRPNFPELSRATLQGESGEELFQLPAQWLLLRAAGAPTLWLRLRGSLTLPAINSSTGVLVVERKRDPIMDMAAHATHSAISDAQVGVDVVHCTLVGEAPLLAPVGPDEGLLRLDTTPGSQVRMLLEPHCAQTLRLWIRHAQTNDFGLSL